MTSPLPNIGVTERPSRSPFWMKTHILGLVLSVLIPVLSSPRSSLGHRQDSRSATISDRVGGEVKATAMAGVVQGSCKVLRLPSIYRSSRRAATTTCAASKVDPPNLANLCEKARLTLTAEEVKDFEPQIGRIVDWFAQLQDIDLSNVPPAIRVGEIDPTKTLRPDTPKIFADREAMLASAPDRDGPFLKVPKIMKENQE